MPTSTARTAKVIRDDTSNLRIADFTWLSTDHPPRWPGHIPHTLAQGGSHAVLLTAFYIDNGKKIPLLGQLPTAAHRVLPALIAMPVIARTAVRHQNPPPASPGQGHAPGSG